MFFYEGGKLVTFDWINGCKCSSSSREIVKKYDSLPGREGKKDFGIEYPHSNIKEIHLRECVREPSKSTFQTCFLSVLAAK